MNSTSRRIFPLLKPLSPLVLEPLKAVAQTANSLSLRYFLAGAIARVLENISGLPPGKFAFLQNHREVIAAFDFFIVPTFFAVFRKCHV